MRRTLKIVDLEDSQLANLSRLQRKILRLAFLAYAPGKGAERTVTDALVEVYGWTRHPPPWEDRVLRAGPRANRVAVVRALRRLDDRGLVDLKRRGGEVHSFGLTHQGYTVAKRESDSPERVQDLHAWKPTSKPRKTTRRKATRRKAVASGMHQPFGPWPRLPDEEIERLVDRISDDARRLLRRVELSPDPRMRRVKVHCCRSMTHDDGSRTAMTYSDRFVSLRCGLPRGGSED